MELNKVYNMDCIEGMRSIPDNSVDMIIADPPYNIGKEFENDNLPLDKYLEWCNEWIEECCRILKWGGAIYITIGWQTVAEVKTIFSNYPVRLKNWIIWYRQDGWKGDKGFAQSYEHILYFIKDKISSDIHSSFISYLNERRIERGLSLSDINLHFGWATNGGGCASSYMGDKEENYLPTSSHYKKLKDLLELDNRFDWLPFGVKFNKTDECNDLWLNPKSEKSRLGHPTQKPLRLFQRMIEASSDINDIILDPFMGSGTTAFACKSLSRNYICLKLVQSI